MPEMSSFTTTSEGADHQAKPPAVTTTTTTMTTSSAQYVPPSSDGDSDGGAPSSRGSWFQRAKAEATFLLTTKEGLIGNYDYAWLLTPDIPPFNRKYKDRKMLFHGINDRIPFLLTLLLGLQHALAMIGGVVSPPLLIAGASGANLSHETLAYLVSTALILSGVFSFFQIMRVRIFNTGLYVGTGMLSVVGEAFAIVPITTPFFQRQYDDGICKKDSNGAKLPCPEAYGKVLGTVAVVMLFQILLSLVKPRVLRKIFPNIVTGMVLVCIGANLVSSGMKSWAGGSGPCMAKPTNGFFKNCPNNDAPHPLPWGHPSFLGLGLSVYITILLVEVFGSPLLRNASIVIGLLVGTIIASTTGYIDAPQITPLATFPWTHTFPLSFEVSLVLPLLACCVTTLVSCLGDIIATAEVSGLGVEDSDVSSSININTRVQGGLTADGIWSVLAALATSTPVVCFAQNNGVIALTGCASRRAGYAACFFLITAGIFSPFGSAVVALPSSVIGGMTTFLFTSITVSGLRILSSVKWNRRNRFIATAALALGISDLVVPNWADGMMPRSGMRGLDGFYEGIELLIKTAYTIVAIVAVALNLIMPEEKGSGGGDGGHGGEGEGVRLPVVEGGKVD